MWLLVAHALPMFREPRQRSTRKQLEKDRLDPLKSHKPEPPVAGPGDRDWSSWWPTEGVGGGGGQGSLRGKWEDALLLIAASSLERFYYMVVFKHFLFSIRTFCLKDAESWCIKLIKTELQC